MKFLSGLVLLILTVSFSEHLLSSPGPTPSPSAAPVPSRLPESPAAPASPSSQSKGSVPVPPPPPPPRSAAELPAPPIPPRVQPSTPLTALEIQRITPVVEVWRAGATSPQIPARRREQMAVAYVSDNQPIMVRLQFDPRARGKRVIVRPGRGVILDPSAEVLQIQPTGDCIVTVRLAENASRGHLSFHYDGLMTTVPLSRNSLAAVRANENGGGR